MSALRSKKNSRYNNISRDALSQQSITAVDTFLKSLRKLQKNVTNNQSTHTSELQLIDRISYKSRNQHGIALFWRSLSEVRRYAKSIEGNSLSALIDSVRSSFYLLEEKNPTAWKTTPWRHVPEKTFLENVLTRIKRCNALYSKAAGAYQKAYIAFSRFSNSTSFLPLSVTLLGIVARFHVLVMDMDNDAKLLWQGCHKLLQDLEPSHQACKCKPPKNMSPVESLDDPVPQTHDVQMLEPDQADLGEIISRPEVSLPNPVAAENIVPELTMPQDNIVEVEEDMVSHIAITNVSRPSQPTGQATTSKSIKRKSQKSKMKPQDEIDLIFG